MTAATEDTTAIVVGGGFGGLAVACYLADAGVSVAVFEQNDQLGGRASVLEVDGFRFDMGPSWYLMPDVFERFFESFGRSPTEYYDLQHLDPHYRVFFKDGDRVDMTGDVNRTKAVFERYEDGAGAALDEYLERSRKSYEVGMEHFVYTDRPRFRDYLDPTVVCNAHGLGLLRSMEEHVGSYFEHSKLQQLVQYSLVFLGGSPSNTPALYNLMSHVDMHLGVHYPSGGIGTVVDAIVSLAQELGVEFHTGSAVEAISGVRGDMHVQFDDRASVRADVVVSDADYAHTEQELLDPANRQYDDDYWTERTYAPSAFLLYLGVKGDLEPLAHHSLVLPAEWDSHFDAIFESPSWPDDPAYYLCAPSKTDETVAPDDHSALFALVPIAPGLEDSPEQRESFRDAVLADISTNTGVDLRDRIVVEETFSVSEFGSRYNAREGTALGLAHTLGQTGPLRPDHRSGAMDGLYFTGGYTRPGIGVPMCLISGEHAANAVLEDLGGQVT